MQEIQLQVKHSILSFGITLENTVCSLLWLPNKFSTTLWKAKSFSIFFIICGSSYNFILVIYGNCILSIQIYDLAEDETISSSYQSVIISCLNDTLKMVTTYISLS